METIKGLIHGQVIDIYRQKEMELPVKVGLARFMPERQAQPGQSKTYDREGLFHWAKQRFGEAAKNLSEETIRTEPRARLHEKLLEISREYFPKIHQEEIDEQLDAAFRGTRVSEKDDAQELADWAKTKLQLDVDVAALTGVTKDQATQVLWSAFDLKYRPEMRRIERGLLLNRLDASWKNHLYTMDHLRSTIGLRSYAQVDPKVEYKREGMKEFDSMWEGVHDKVTDALFRLEEEVDFQESLWDNQVAVHETAPQVKEEDIRGQQDAAIANSQQTDKKKEPIRRRGERVGRNDPCPCNSGKKYKNCCMRQAG
jgi:preprotein translocase subunit SecA